MDGLPFRLAERVSRVILIGAKQYEHCGRIRDHHRVEDLEMTLAVCDYDHVRDLVSGAARR